MSLQIIYLKIINQLNIRLGKIVWKTLKFAWNTLWNILTRETYDEVIICLAINLNSSCYKNVYYINSSFVKVVILIEIDFN